MTWKFADDCGGPMGTTKFLLITQGSALLANPIWERTAFYTLRDFCMSDERLQKCVQFIHLPLPGLEGDICARLAFLSGVEDKLKTISPNIVGLSLYGWNRQSLLHVAALCKSVNPAITVVVGGPDSFGEGQRLLYNYPALDMVVEHDGELPLQRILQHFALGEGKLTDIPLTTVRDGKTIVQSSQTDFIHDLNEIPSTVQSLTAEDLTSAFQKTATPFATIETSRGCAIGCAYCSFPRGKSVRYRSLDRVFEDLRRLKKLSVKEVYFTDGVLTLDAKRVGKIFDFFLTEYQDCRFTIEVKLDNLPAKLWDAVRELVAQGRIQFGIGIQTTNLETLNRLGRKTNLERYKRTAAAVLSENMVTRQDIIYGLPGDTLDDFISSLDATFEMSTPSTRVSAYHLSVLPGTPLRKKANEFGLVYDLLPPYEAIRTDTMSTGEMWKARVIGIIFFWLARLLTSWKGVGIDIGGICRKLFNDTFFESLKDFAPCDHLLHLSMATKGLREIVPSLSSEDVSRTLMRESIDFSVLVAYPNKWHERPELLIDFPSFVSSQLDRGADCNGKRFKICRAPLWQVFRLDMGQMLARIFIERSGGVFGHGLSICLINLPPDETGGELYLVLKKEGIGCFGPKAYELLQTVDKPHNNQVGLDAFRGMTSEEIDHALKQFADAGWIEPA